MDFVRLGSVFRAIRIKKLWRQSDVAQKAGVSRTAVSRLETGHARELGLDEILRIAEALDVAVKVLASWRGGELDRLLNSRHSALHESVAVWFGGSDGWQLAPEVSFSIRGERGVIDILAWHAETRTLLVIELKTEIVDVNELMGRVDVKQRLAGQIARERGWHPRQIAVWVIVADSSTNRRRVQRHVTVLRSAFPMDGRAMSAWLRAPATSVRAMSFWANARGQSTTAPLATVKRVRRPAVRAA